MKPMNLPRTIALLCAATAGAHVSTAGAQSEPQAGEGGLETVVVTANRRLESQQLVPMTITTFTPEQLTTQGVSNAIALPLITPGLSVTRTLVGANLFLRGVGTTSAGYSTEAPIAMYLDGLYLPNSAAAAFSFNNIERIEVLKGPQGTLYGRNTTGGLIHVITKEPGDVAALDASVSYANYDTVSANFYGSLPLGETLAANFAATYTDQSEGWGTNQFLGDEAYLFKDLGFQAKLRWTPNDATTITLRGFYDEMETDQGNNAGIYPGSVAIDGTPFLGEFQTATRVKPWSKQRQYNLSLKAEFDLGAATLTSLTGYIDNRSPSNQVQNGIPGNPVLGQSAVYLDGVQTAETVSQEFNLASNPSDSRLSWIAGLFYYHDETMIQTDVYGTCIGTTCAPAPVPTRTTGRPETTSYSGYGEGTWSFTDATRLTLGLRYTNDHKTLEGFAEPSPGHPNTLPALPPTAVIRPGDPYPGNPAGIDTDVTWDELTWKVAFAHDFSDRVNSYVSYNRGFKSGGFNPISFVNQPSDPEILDAYEIGLKTELFNRQLRFNIAAYYYDYSDIQLRTTAPPSPPGGSILFNAANAEMKGIDADFVWVPTDKLTINGGVAWLDAEYTEFPSGICTSPRPIGGPILGGVVSVPCDLAGHTPPSAPELSYSLSVTYAFDTSIGGFSLNASDSYKSDYFWEPGNRLRQDAFHVVNASVTWTALNPAFSVQLFGRNLADEFYFASGAEGAAGNDLQVPAPPRSYGVMLRYQF